MQFGECADRVKAWTMMFRNILVLLADPRLPDRSKPGGGFTADDFDQVKRLRAALTGLTGRKFRYLDDHRDLYTVLRDAAPEFVLNFCDTGLGNDARRELHVPALLEMLNLRYSGSGPVALGLCYDKSLVRAVAATHAVPVPDEVFLRAGDALPDFSYPAFVKPNRGDGSVGISEAAIVADARAAQARIDALREELPGCDILLQEYLSGTEYGFGLIGNVSTGFTALPMLEVDYSKLDPQLPRLLSYSSKVDPASPYWTDISFGPASLDKKMQRQVHDWCASLYDRLQLRDYARFDFRADGKDQLKLMEINPNPAWCWDGKLAHMGELAGLDHGDVIELIIQAAEQRCASVSV
jgi:D-alanine-D-alanine ligase